MFKGNSLKHLITNDIEWSVEKSSLCKLVSENVLNTLLKFVMEALKRQTSSLSSHFGRELVQFCIAGNRQ